MYRNLEISLRCVCRFRSICKQTAILIFGLILCPHAMAADANTENRANVVVILTDDQGWGDLSRHGNPNLSTPNIDALARKGAALEQFYVCAVCSPTRAEFLTGRYHTRMGVYSTSSGGERFSADEATIAEHFRANGYATAAYGKWHSGMQYPYHPNARGFDDYYGFCSGHWGNYFSPMLEHNGQIVEGSGFIVDDFTNHAIDFISQHRDEPFFVYLPLNTPHSPMQVPDQYWDRFKDKEIVADPDPTNARQQNLTHTRAALAMCENIDDNVGRLVNHLETSGLIDNTIVVYFSDNGPNGARFNGGMRGRKGSTTEGGLRSPGIVRFDKEIQPGTTVDKVTAAIDLMPTLLDLAGVSVEYRKQLDGRSIAPLLRGDDATWTDREVYSAWKSKASIRTDQYRMQLTGELYDIRADQRETTDLAKDRPDVAAELSRKLKKWIQETKSDTNENRPFTLAHPDAEFTQLPARDAIGHGGILRSNKFPNCSFLHDWKSTSDKITWDVEVLSEGDYEVEFYYAVDQEDVGATIELSIGDAKLKRKIDVANESPLVGAGEDRYKRAESYVKHWKSLTLGTLHLVPGRETLELRATDIPGKEVAQVRLLMLTRKSQP
tara:strand:+ start:22966 stop:24792 length:1827 start_codon:yes stop_codon:yes gene_type:complete